MKSARRGVPGAPEPSQHSKPVVAATSTTSKPTHAGEKGAGPTAVDKRNGHATSAATSARNGVREAPKRSGGVPNARDTAAMAHAGAHRDGAVVSGISKPATTRAASLGKLRALGRVAVAHSEAVRHEAAAVTVGESATHKVSIRMPALNVTTRRTSVTDGGDPANRDDDAHMEACVRELGVRIAACKSRGAAFEDKAFEGDAALGDADLISRCGGWHRVSELYPGATLCGDRFDPRMPRQGRVANCYIVSSMALVATRAAFMPRVFVNKKENEYGVYGVRLWHHGAWQTIFVDDRFPISRTELRRTADDVLHATDTPNTVPEGFAPVPLCMRLRYGKAGTAAFWPMILEKAFAKLYGSYAAIGHRGWPEAVLTALVPRTTAGCILLHATENAERVRNGALWKDVRAMESAGWLLVAVAAGTSDGTVTPQGIVQGHAYSVLRTAEVHDGSVRLVQLRNSWAAGEWTGAWGDADVSRWTSSVRAQLNYHPSGDKSEWDDGIFWMAWDDVVREFSSLHFVRRFVSSGSSSGGLWWSATLRGMWPPHLLREPRIAVHDVSQFTVKAGEPATTVYAIAQAMAESDTPVTGTLLLAAQPGGHRCAEWAPSTRDAACVLQTNINTDNACVKVELNPYDEWTFIPMPNTVAGSREFEFHVYADHPLLSPSAFHTGAPHSGSPRANIPGRVALPVTRIPMGLPVSSSPRTRARTVRTWHPLYVRDPTYFLSDAEKWSAVCIDGTWPAHSREAGGVIDLETAEQFTITPRTSGLGYVLLEVCDATTSGSCALGISAETNGEPLAEWGVGDNGSMFLFDASPEGGPPVACVQAYLESGKPVVVAAEHNTLPSSVKAFRVWLAVERSPDTPRDVAMRGRGFAGVVAALRTTQPKVATKASAIRINVLQSPRARLRMDSTGVVEMPTPTPSASSSVIELPDTPVSRTTTTPAKAAVAASSAGVATTGKESPRPGVTVSQDRTSSARPSRSSSPRSPRPQLAPIQTNDSTLTVVGAAAVPGRSAAASSSPRSPRSPRSAAATAKPTKARSLSPRLQRLAMGAGRMPFWRILLPRRIHDERYFVERGWTRTQVDAVWPAAAMGHAGVVLELTSQFLLEVMPGGRWATAEPQDIYAVLRMKSAGSGTTVLAATRTTGKQRIEDWGVSPIAGEEFVHDATADGSFACVHFTAMPEHAWVLAPLPNTWTPSADFSLSVYSKCPIRLTLLEAPPE